jgi:amino acid transporter
VSAFLARIRATGADRPQSSGARPISTWAFLGVAIVSLGGPLSLAALNAPDIVSGAGGTQSAGLAMVASVVVFAFPLVIWLRYAREINSSGGLYSFVDAAAGRRVAQIQAGLWIVSYLLYILYTTIQIVYDTLPVVLPGEVHYQPLLAILIPVALAGTMIAGRRAALLVIGLLAVGQVAIAIVLDGVTLTNIATPLGSFGASAPAGSLATSSGQTALLYICASLPLFLGGELAQPARTVRRGLIAAYLVTAALIIAAVAPLAANPALAAEPIPGMSIAQRFVGHGFAVTVGVGVAASIVGVMLVEYLALSRLVSAVTAWPSRWVVIAIGVVVVVVAPFTLINPQAFYNALSEPSLIALWLSQLIVFAVYPMFALKRGSRMLPVWLLTAVSVAISVYGLWAVVQNSSS